MHFTIQEQGKDADAIRNWALFFCVVSTILTAADIYGASHTKLADSPSDVVLGRAMTYILLSLFFEDVVQVRQPRTASTVVSPTDYA